MLLSRPIRRSYVLLTSLFGQLLPNDPSQLNSFFHRSLAPLGELDKAVGQVFVIDVEYLNITW